MKLRFHILAVPHAVTTSEYSTCAFTTKIVKLCRMLRALGHTVIHYGHERSVVDCDEHVTITTDSDLAQSYPGHDWRTMGFPDFKHTEDRIYQIFYAKATGELYRRKQAGDFLLCPFGIAHEPVARSHSDMIVVEPGVGYPATFAKFRVFESYAVMHGLYGPERVATMFKGEPSPWYDAVIPNYFDLDDFEFSANKSDDFLFLGRIGDGKGTNIAAEVVRTIGGRLLVAGMGDLSTDDHVVKVGIVNPAQRKKLLANAKATICPSMYVEPFCGVQIESMLSGTPVISTDFGAFAEYNLHGVTGYRCRTFEQFVWAARNIGGISPQDCRDWAARNFSMERVAQMYEEYFWGLAMLHQDPKGWYHENPERRELDWLRRYTPGDGM